MIKAMLARDRIRRPEPFRVFALLLVDFITFNCFPHY